jgi:carboxypeptidase T
MPRQPLALPLLALCALGLSASMPAVSARKASPAAGISIAAPRLQDDHVFITARYRTDSQLKLAAARFQHMMVDRRARTFRTEADLEDIVALRKAGLAVSIDVAATQRMRKVEQVQAETSPTDSYIAGFPCYRTVEETYDAMMMMAKANPGRASLVDIGPSWLRTRSSTSGHRMLALRLTNAETDAALPDKPVMVLQGELHAREYTTTELLLRFAEWLVYGYGNDSEATWLMDNFRFDFVLLANPDGRKKAETGLSWRKNVNTDNGPCDADDYGVDLNRNFPYQWSQTDGGSSGAPCAVNYRGTSPQSEPEAANVLRYVAGVPNASNVYSGGVFPDRRGDSVAGAAPTDYRGMFLDIHSYSQRVLWPWSYTNTQPGNVAELRTLGRRLAYFNGYTPQQWIGMYPADGTSTDTMYGLLGVPSYTIELGVAFFETCATFEGSTLPQNVAALRYAARNLFAPYVYPAGPDTTAISLAPAVATGGASVNVSAIVDDSTFNQDNGTEPVQAIASARAYLDQPPWAAGAVGVPMTAGDGSFDGSMEVVSATIPTSGLAPGRHVVYVRGTDASGRPGTPKAMHFLVDPPPCSGRFGCP